jgi:DNA-binding LacI/PurR family transcriptional regulator
VSPLNKNSVDGGRVTMKDVAVVAGVSASTVCRALNANPQIPEATRQRIQAVADKLGYRPDPLLSAFAARRRGSSANSNVTTIAYITNFTSREIWLQNPFYRCCYEGAKRRLEGQGYQLEHFWLGDTNMTADRLSRILYSRGILGLLLAPMPYVHEPLNLDWEKFSCATIGYSHMAPILHRSTPHHFHAMQEVLKRLYALGYQRVGLCVYSDTSRRVDELWLSAALLAQNDRLKGIGKKDRAFHISTFLFNDSSLKDTPAWCRKEKLEVVISDNPLVMEELRQAGIDMPGVVDFVSLSWFEGQTDLAGVDQRPRDIGAAASDLIVGALQRGERGVPAVPLTTMVEGTWVDGPSLARKAEAFSRDDCVDA